MDLLDRLEFNYDKDKKFDIYIYYTQKGDFEPYIFHDILTLKDLDFIRKSSITGDYEQDAYVFYKQLMSKIYKKYGKLKAGDEVVKINGDILYTNTQSPFEESFRHEKDLNSPNNDDYLDKKISPGEYSFI